MVVTTMTTTILIYRKYDGDNNNDQQDEVLLIWIFKAQCLQDRVSLESVLIGIRRVHLVQLGAGN